mgnify:CR=1 FL=1
MRDLDAERSPAIPRELLTTDAEALIVNADIVGEVEQLARALTPEQLLLALDAIATARERIAANVPPLLALEAMCIALELPL